MSYLFVVAVVGGAASVLTPCVLPLLPAILAISGGRGRRRVWGIALGIEISFFVIAIALAGAISSLGLPADVLRYAAAVLLASFGLVLIVPKLDEAFSRAVARLTARVPQGARNTSGFAGGFLAGLPLGLVWAPCAGPILAGITVAASASRFSSRTVWTMVGYAIGMAGPLAAVIFGGQKLSLRLRSALGGGRRVLATMGVVLLATAALIGFGGLNSVNRFIATHVDLTSTPTAALEQRALARPAASSDNRRIDLSRIELEANGYPEIGRLADLGPAPAFAGISRWYNSKPLSIASLRGKVVLVDFWTYSCINCIRTLPHLRSLYADYASKGLVIVGVHTPEFGFEKDPGNVGRAVKDFGIHYPVALDPSNSTWDNYYNRYWPAHYLIDRTGHIRSVHFGEGEYARTENEVRTLLGMKPDATGADDRIQSITPETYLGSNRADRFAGQPHDLVRGAHGYVAPAQLDADHWSYGGVWSVGGERATAGSRAFIKLHFRSAKVFIVAGPSKNGPGTIRVSGAPGARDATVDTYRLYTVRSGGLTDDTLTLDVSSGVEVYAFTFG